MFEGLHWFSCSPVGVCEALLDIACKKGYTSVMWFIMQDTLVQTALIWTYFLSFSLCWTGSFSEKAQAEAHNILGCKIEVEEDEW